MTRDCTSRKPTRRRKQSGVALLMVMVGVALLGAIVTEYLDNANISTQLAYAARDDLRAHYLARSAINVSRLLLHMQKTFIDPYKRQGMNIQLWKLPFVDSGSLEGLAGGGAQSALSALGIGDGKAAQSLAAETKKTTGPRSEFAQGFSALGGTFTAEIESENGKININACCTPQQIAVLQRQLEGLFLPSQYNPFFDERKEGSNAPISRLDQVSAITDWVDPDTNRSGLSGGYEDDRYQRMRDPYKSKNSKFDTLQELLLVDGVDDDFFHAFSGRLTIYGGAQVVNVATADSEVIKALIRAYVAPNDPLRDPLSQALDPLVQRFILYRMGLSDMGTPMMMFANPINDPAAFTNWMTGQNVMLDQRLIGGVIGVDDRVFSIKATARVGSAWKKMNVVIDNAAPGGRVLYWRED
jgi:general secretion pathway protein K